MSGKVRNIILLSCAAAVLCCTLGFKVLYRAGFPLPEFLGVGEEQSYLERRSYTKLPLLTGPTILDGTFQSDFESYIDDALPLRESLLNVNKRLQRLGIRQGALIMGYDVYHNFFSSSLIYYPGGDRILEGPIKSTASSTSRLTESAEAINRFSLEHALINVYFAMPYRSGILNMGPVENLVNDQLDVAALQSLLYDKLDAVSAVIDLRPVSYDSFDASYFKTDHHWNIIGAYDAYKAISSAMGNDDTEIPAGELIVFDKARFLGSAARKGLNLDVSGDVILDYSFNLPELTVYKQSKKYSNDFLYSIERYSSGYIPSNPCEGLYEDYFHGNFGEFTITNPESSRKKTLLIVADSFSNCIERLFANSYQTVYVYDPRYAEETVSEFVDAHPEVDDVLFLMDYYTLTDTATVKSLQ